MLRLQIDGKTFSARPGQTILEVARENGIPIPTLCYHPRLSLLKSCRICLVEVQGVETPMASCATPVVDGMVILTRTERVEQMRREALKLLLVNHPLDCPVCDAGGECQLQNRTYEFGIERNEFPPQPRDLPPSEYGTPLIRQWFDRCVMCLRCIQACQDIPGANVLDVAEHGFSAHVKAVRKEHCISCGECLHMCPVGALTENLSPIKGRTWQLSRTRTTCTFCGCGCQIELNSLAGKKVVNVTTHGESGVNQGSLCVKGRFGYDFIHHPDRLLRPMLRKSGSLVESSWEEALSFVANRLQEIKEQYGPQAIGGISSSRATNEEIYLFQKWMRACIGTNQLDSGARLSGGPAFLGLLGSTGSGAMSHAMEDVAKADLILLIGADVYDDNLIFSHRMREAVRSNNAKIIVVDPRRTKWEQWADLWLRPVPGTDLTWINGLSRLLIEKGIPSGEWIESGTEGYEAFRSTLDSFSPTAVQAVTGISPGEMEALTRLYGSARRRAVVFGSGVIQHLHGFETVQALADLALLTGETESGGGGLYPLLPQNNAQGAFDMGSFSEFLPGHVRIDESSKRLFAYTWEREIPAHPGRSYQEILDGTLSGKIKALFVFGEDPMLTLPNIERLQNGLRRLELLVVQDLFQTHTGRFAHVLLPGCSFAEKEGTFTSMERRVQRVRQAIRPLGESRPDWKILCDLSARMGYPMTYSGPGEVMDEIASTIPFYSGITYSGLNQNGIQWPLPKGKKKRFLPVEKGEPPEQPDEGFPLRILLRGFHDHYGIGTTDKRARGLAKVFTESCLEMHPGDAHRFGILDGDAVQVSSPRGTIETVCRVSDGLPQGTAYYAKTFFPVPVNDLLASGQHPVSQTLEMKYVIGRVEKRQRRG